MDEVQALQTTARELDDLLARALNDRLKVQEIHDQLETQLASLPARVAEISRLTSDLTTVLADIRNLGPATSGIITEVRTALRPSRLRTLVLGWILIMATMLATVLAASLAYPGWTLRERGRQSLDLGSIILNNMGALSTAEQATLEELLQKLASSSNNSSTR